MIGKIITFFIWMMIVPFGEDSDCKNAYERSDKWNKIGKFAKGRKQE